MNTEVTIVGAGSVGLMMSALLLKHNIPVCLVDKQPSLTSLTSNVFLGRTAALNLFSKNIFQELNLFKEVLNFATPFNEIKTWDSSGSSKVEFKASEASLDNLGFVVSNNALIKLLFDFNTSNPLFTFLGGSALKAIEQTENNVEIELEDEKKICSKLLVGADGGLSTVRDKANIEVNTWSYEQRAVITTLSSEKSHGNVAIQVFTPTGPIALLPFDSRDSKRISLIWSINNDSVDAILSLSKENFCKELESKVESELGKFSLLEEIKSFPLHQLHTKKYFNGRSVVIGDAAHTIHPLAGQGLNLGIADAESLIRSILIAKRTSQDIGSIEVLQRFQKDRFLRNMSMMGLMELFKRGFQTDNPWIKLGRNLLFRKTNEINLIKKRFIKEAAGI